MQVQRGLKKDSTLTKFVLGAHPIIEHFIEKMRIREIISTYMASDKRMKLDDDKVLTLLIHNILTTPYALYEMEEWAKLLEAEKEINAKRQAAADEAENEAVRAEADAKAQADAEAKAKADEEARLKAEEDARRKAEEEAQAKAAEQKAKIEHQPGCGRINGVDDRLFGFLDIHGCY